VYRTDSDSAASIKQRAVKKLQLEGSTSEITAAYEWHMVRYSLDDGERRATT
jgi:hypothetical protein